MKLKLIFADGEGAGDVSDLAVAAMVYDIICELPYADTGAVARMLLLQSERDKQLMEEDLARPCSLVK